MMPPSVTTSSPFDSAALHRTVFFGTFLLRTNQHHIEQHQQNDGESKIKQAWRCQPRLA